MNEYQLKAYAKINLGLDVTGKLPNGYHQVKMIMQSIGLWDELTLQKTDHGISVTTDSDLLPTDENNLIYKAAKLMFEKYKIRSGVRIHLQKNIPIAAGMAGGSTDAAAAMKGIAALFGLDASLARLMEYAVSIGADVPYCLMGGTALAEGIGEKLTPLPPLPDCFILVAKPDIMVSTKYVYEHLDAGLFTPPVGCPDARQPDFDAAGGTRPDIDKMADALRAGDLPGVLTRMKNVLETVTIPAYPIINEIKDRMLALGAAGCLMSGSGPTVFGIFRKEDAQNAQTAFRRFQQEPKKNAVPGAAEPLAEQVFLVRPVSNP